MDFFFTDISKCTMQRKDKALFFSDLFSFYVSGLFKNIYDAIKINSYLRKNNCPNFYIPLSEIKKKIIFVVVRKTNDFVRMCGTKMI